MNDYSFFPPEGVPYSEDLMLHLSQLIQHLRYVESKPLLFKSARCKYLMSLFDQEVLDLLYKLKAAKILDGLIHIYKDRTDNEPSVTILASPSVMSIFRNV